MIEISEKTFKEIETLKVTGSPEQMKGRSLIQFNDSLTMGLGPDPLGEGFTKIADCMMNGDYYPDEIIRFEGRFRQESRTLRVGDRLLQFARFPFLPGYRSQTVAVVSVAERTDRECKIGYYTTSRHFAKGWWQATLSQEEDELVLLVQSQARPQSLVYWLAIPIARFMQVRARRSAILRFASWM
jgi:hypothetical protein